MTGDELTHRYEALRRAATAVIESTAADPAPVFPAHQQKLDALAQALTGPESQDVATREIIDPDLHLLSMLDYERGVPGGAPFSLAHDASEIRESMAKDDVAEHPRGYYPDEWNPTLTELRAMIVATLLQELAARLTATGDPGGHELAAVARELADEVLAPTFAGAQR
ncbi:hypothetical protein EV193_10325 [Herbihabitans rhizosphaerae]|uniref:Uncharacterized protein n=1 Tax=Herbihabitans rhizosphaerae TaxID=1872711 RepID=A0A4Q7KVH5_9PSEU|nr:hypothetical protein [Herbihabitans rhizosphaerae]RZS40714.1 hypothetical protein EV193_10325 [Herbihabitans rhizosphaerae]